MRDRIDTRTFGWRVRNGAVRSVTIGRAVGMTPSRRLPDSPARTICISSFSARMSLTIRRAQSSTRAPSGVSPWNRDAPEHELHAKLILELPDRRRQRGLRHPADLGRPAEVTFVGQRDEHFQLVDHVLSSQHSGPAATPRQVRALHRPPALRRWHETFHSLPANPPHVPVIRLRHHRRRGPHRRGPERRRPCPADRKGLRTGASPPRSPCVINSPGGSPVQSSLIAARIRRLAEEKGVEVHAFVEDVAASGGYWLACAGDRHLGRRQLDRRLDRRDLRQLRLSTN